ncbi:cation-translocating P-type ATPase [candidate division KSB1 bacterium]|nr:cation-translocating P-type ATPase [candidate division KSB1 bacterium]
MFWSRIKCTLALILKFRFEMGLKKAGWYWRWNSRDSMAGVLAGNFSDSERILAVSWELILLSLTVYLFGRLPLWSSTSLVVYLPCLHQPFGTFSLSASDLRIILGLAFSVSPILELVKWFERRGWFGKLS